MEEEIDKTKINKKAKKMVMETLTMILKMEQKLVKQMLNLKGNLLTIITTRFLNNRCLKKQKKVQLLP